MVCEAAWEISLAKTIKRKQICQIFYTSQVAYRRIDTTHLQVRYIGSKFPGPHVSYRFGSRNYRSYEESFAEAIAPLDARAYDFIKLPRDADVVSEEDLSVYAAALDRNGFFGPSSWYMNHAANAAYAATALNGGYLDMPVLFLTAAYDFVCECVHSRLPEPMRTYCRNLTEATIRSGHWMAQERPVEVNAALVNWLATSVSDVWPRPE